MNTLVQLVDSHIFMREDYGEPLSKKHAQNMRRFAGQLDACASGRSDDWLTLFKRYFRERQFAPSTAAQCVWSLGSLMRSHSILSADEWKYLAKNFRKPPANPVLVDPACISALINYIVQKGFVQKQHPFVRSRNIALVLFLALTGARISEALALRRRDLVSFENPIQPGTTATLVLLQTAKQHTPRNRHVFMLHAKTVGYTPAAGPWLAYNHLLDATGSPFLFPGIQQLSRPVGIRTVQQMFREGAQYGEFQLTPKDLRACAAQSVFAQGGTTVASEFLGHSRHRTTATAHYAGVTLPDILRAQTGATLEAFSSQSAPPVLNAECPQQTLTRLLHEMPTHN